MLISKAFRSSDWSLQLDSMKPDSLVIAHQPWRGEYVPGPCTHRPSSHGSWGCLKIVTVRSDLGQNQWLGLSRNKVAVPEGVAGTPPFWRDDDVRQVSYIQVSYTLNLPLLHLLYIQTIEQRWQNKDKQISLYSLFFALWSGKSRAYKKKARKESQSYSSVG